MSTDKLKSTGNVSLQKEGMRIASAHDLDELSDQELQMVTGGCRCDFFGCPSPRGGSCGSHDPFFKLV